MSGLKTKPMHRDVNPLVQGINDFLNTHKSAAHAKSDSSDFDGHDLEQSDIPKRYTVYTPMLLIGTSFENFKPAWQAFWSGLDSQERQVFWACVVDRFRAAGQKVSVVALNGPIAAKLSTENEKYENILRSPSGLIPLYGDFGPDHLANAANDCNPQPGTTDFESALWVEVVQLRGIVQVWAPRWTMFSRGNIKEKERILSSVALGHENSTANEDRKHRETIKIFPGLTMDELGQHVGDVDVVDFYVGIGYFAFCYLKRGVRRVWGWELNGWSVEGLRRGCERNGWKCLVVRITEQENDHVTAVNQVVMTLRNDTNLRCIVFCGDNKWASKILNAIQKSLASESNGLNVRHCNLGLLPTSRGSWEGAMAVLNHKQRGWLHVHENADIHQVDKKEEEVLHNLQKIGSANQLYQEAQITCQYAHMVKTFAPGVGHFVFDVKLNPENAT